MRLIQNTANQRDQLNIDKCSNNITWNDELQYKALISSTRSYDVEVLHTHVENTCHTQCTTYVEST